MWYLIVIIGIISSNDIEKSQFIFSYEYEEACLDQAEQLSRSNRPKDNQITIARCIRGDHKPLIPQLELDRSILMFNDLHKTR